MLTPRIENAKKRLTAQKDANARKFILQEILPLMLAMQEQYEATTEATDRNFKEIYSALGLSMNYTEFMDYTKSVVMQLSAFVDFLLTKTGSFEINEVEGLKPKEDADQEIIKTLEAIQESMTNWHQQFEVIYELAEEDEGEDEDEEEDEGEGEGEKQNIQIPRQPTGGEDE